MGTDKDEGPCDSLATAASKESSTAEPIALDIAETFADESVRSLVLLCLDDSHPADDARRLAREGARAQLLDILKQSLAVRERALMELDADHPSRGALIIERERLRRLIAIVAQLTSSSTK